MFDPQEREKIRAMVFYVAGAGGLGTHQAQQIQRIGAQKLYITDIDHVEESNLNRQILYGYRDLGHPKSLQAKKSLTRFELPTKIVPLQEKVGENMVIPEDVDVVLDALDSVPARLHLEKASKGHGLPMVHGGVHSWYGQVTTIVPQGGFSLKMLFHEHAEEDEIPAFSPVVSLVASLQVLEAVKLLLGYKDVLTGKLLILNARQGTMDIISMDTGKEKESCS